VATSGTYIFNPDLAEIVDEAFDRCRVDPALLTARHILSARRSMRFMLTDWATDEFHDFRIRRLNFTLVDGQAVYGSPTYFPANVIDVLQMVLRDSGVDTPVTLMSRSEYLDIPSKDTEGRTDRIFIDKQRDGLTGTVWPVPDNSTDVLYYDAVVKFEDSDTASDNADIPWYMHDAFAAGLAARLAEKYAPPELEEKLWLKGERALKKASIAARGMGDVVFRPGGRR
jgi:hypothetical protein